MILLPDIGIYLEMLGFALFILVANWQKTIYDYKKFVIRGVLTRPTALRICYISGICFIIVGLVMQLDFINKIIL